MKKTIKLTVETEEESFNVLSLLERLNQLDIFKSTLYVVTEVKVERKTGTKID